MAFIETISAQDATGDVKAMYERQFLHYGYVPGYAFVFCHRPEIMRLWAQLQSGIKRHMDKRRFELVTFAAAHELRSTLCSLAHGKALTEFFSAADVMAIARGDKPAALSDAEAAMLEFARKVARDAASVTAGDVERLKGLGFTDAEIFDITATAAARAFWTKVIESLGVEADAPFHAMDRDFTEALTAGRPLVAPDDAAGAGTLTDCRARSAG
ncbi:MAG TPA: peroxidase [Gammaproteobacteria bacterium]